MKEKFDTQKAREICERIKGYEDPDAGNRADFAAALMLPAALDRIEELEKQNAALVDLVVDERAAKIMLIEKLKSVANDPKWRRKGPSKELSQERIAGRPSRGDGMRSSLSHLRDKRTPVAARFAGVSRRGHVILENVRTIAGQSEYVWIPFEEWKEKLPFPGSEIRFEATAREYYSDHRNCFDYGLTDIHLGGSV